MVVGHLTIPFVLAALAESAGPAVDETENRLLVVILHAGHDVLAAKLGAEVASLGFGYTTVLTDGGDPQPPRIETVARQLGAVAGMRVMPSGTAVEVWVSDEMSGVNVETEVAIDKRSDRMDALLALKAVELLRASMMKVAEPAEKATRPIQPKPKPAEIESSPSFPSLSFAMEPAATHGFGELPPTMNLCISLEWRSSTGMGLHLFGMVPTFPMRLVAEEGSADIRVGMVAIGPVYEFQRMGSRWRPRLGAAIGPGFMRMRGHAEEEYKDSEALLVFAVGYIHFGLSFALNRVLSIRADVLGGWPFRRPVIGFADRELTAWGRPILSGMLGIEAWLL